MKKLLSILLTITLIICTLPIVSITTSAATYGNLTYKISNGEVTITDCSSSASGALEIPATIEGYPVTSIGDYAFENCTSLTNVEIPNSVITIGDSAFDWCTGLTSVYINDITAWLNIDFGNYSANPLYYANNLYLNNQLVTDLVIPQGVTKIKDYAFRGCTGLTSIEIPNSVTSIGDNAFYGCVNLKTVDNYSKIYIFKGKTDNGDIGYYAQTVNNYNATPNGKCGENVTWSFDEDTGILKIEGTGEMEFYNLNIYPEGYYSEPPWYGLRELITSVEISDGVTSIGNFADCINLTKITIPQSVTYIFEYAFYNCSNLEEITIPEKVENISYCTFENCTSLSKVTFNEGIIRIMDRAFYNCTSLKEINFPNSLWQIWDYRAFGNCTGLEKITVGSENEYYYVQNNCLIDKETKTLVLGCKTSIIPDDVIEIGGTAFYGCTGLTSVTIGDSVTSIGYEAFFGCENLKTVYNYSNLAIVKGSSGNGYVGYYANEIYNYTGMCGTDLTYHFENSTGTLTINGTGDMRDYSYDSMPWEEFRSLIKSVVIGDGVTSIGDYAFYECENLENVTVGKSVESIGNYAFRYCENLNTVNNYSNLNLYKDITANGYLGYYADIINWYGMEIAACGENTEYEFNAATGLLVIRGTGVVTSFPWQNYYTLIKEVIVEDGITCLGDENQEYRAFYGCQNLVKVTLGNNISFIGDYTFGVCTNLKEINIPNSVMEISNCAFIGCGSLIEITIPNGLVGRNAFNGCDNLKKVTIGNGVTQIADYAFYYCNALAEVIIGSGVYSIGEYAFYGSTNLKTVLNYSSLSLEKGSNEYGYVAYYADSLINFKPPVVANVVTHNTVILKYPDLTNNYDIIGLYEFKVNDGEWQSSAVFANLLPNTTYSFYQRVKSTDEYNTNPINVLQITTLESSDYVIPVSVEVKDITVEWGSNIYNEYVLANDGYYNIIPSEIIVTYSDGSKNNYLYPDTYGLVHILSGLENCSEWNIGEKHKLNGVYYCGGGGLPEYQLFYDVNVTVIESEIEKIEYSDVKVIENFKNDYGYYEYYPQITVYYKNGTTEVYDFPNGITPEWYLNSIQGIGPLLQVGFFPIYSDTQSIEPWQVGESYKVTASFMGFSDEFTVTVIENPIKDIIVKTDILYFEDGMKTDVDGVYSFDPTYDFKFELLLNDGTLATVEPLCYGFVFNVYGSPHYAESWIDSLELKLGENIGSVYFNIFGRQWKANYCINLISKKVSEPICTESTDSTVTLKNIDGYEYSKDGINWQTSNVFEGLNPNTEYTFYQRVAETLTHNASESSEALKVKTDKTNVAKPTAPTLYGKTDTSVTLTANTGYEYKMDNGAWQSSNVFEGLEHDTTYTFYCRIAETDTTYASETSTALVVTTYKAFINGDVNGDRIIDTTDLADLKLQLAGGSRTEINQAAADLNSDGIIDTTDLAELKLMLAGATE